MLKLILNECPTLVTCVGKLAGQAMALQCMLLGSTENTQQFISGTQMPIDSNTFLGMSLQQKMR